MGSAYWSSRLAFTKLSHEAAAFLSHTSGRDALRAIEKRSAPVLMKFLTTIATRFEIVVSEKLVAEALPVIGAIGGGMINAAFTEYFSDTARFHFGLRALERRHGRVAIEKCYHERMEISPI